MSRLRILFLFVFGAVILFAGTFPCEMSAQQRTDRNRVPASAKNTPAKNRVPAKKNVDASDDFESKLEKLPGENFSAPWPKVTKLLDVLPAKIVKEKGRENIYETEHFRFTCTAPIALSSLREIARIFEGTYVANLALPLNSPCNYYQVAEKGKLNAYLYETREEYAKQLSSPGVPASSSLGVCRTTDRMETTSILVPFSSLGLEKVGALYKKSDKKVDANTLAHELTHFMSLPGYNYYPIWFFEGLAEYVGNTDYANGRFSFANNKKELVAYTTGYGKDGKGGRGLGKKIQARSLKSFMEQPEGEFMVKNMQFNYGFSTLLVYYFFHLDGKKDAARIKEFLKACQGGTKASVANEKLLDGRTWKQLEKDVARGLKSLGIAIQFEE